MLIKNIISSTASCLINQNMNQLFLKKLKKKKVTADASVNHILNTFII